MVPDSDLNVRQLALTSKLCVKARWRVEGEGRLERAVERVEIVNWQSSEGAEAIAMILSSKRRLY